MFRLTLIITYNFIVCVESGELACMYIRVYRLTLNEENVYNVLSKSVICLSCKVVIVKGIFLISIEYQILTQVLL